MDDDVWNRIEQKSIYNLAQQLLEWDVAMQKQKRKQENKSGPFYCKLWIHQWYAHKKYALIDELNRLGNGLIIFEYETVRIQDCCYTFYSERIEIQRFEVRVHFS